MIRRFSKPVAVLALLVCFAFPAALFAEKEMSNLSIQVTDPKGRPVPRASITLTFVSGKKMLVKKVKSEWSTKTNRDGVADLPDMPVGKIHLQVIASGYKTIGEDFELTAPEMKHAVKLERPSGNQYSSHEAEPQPEEKKP